MFRPLEFCRIQSWLLTLVFLIGISASSTTARAANWLTRGAQWVAQKFTEAKRPSHERTDTASRDSFQELVASFGSAEAAREALDALLREPTHAEQVAFTANAEGTRRWFAELIERAQAIANFDRAPTEVSQHVDAFIRSLEARAAPILAQPDLHMKPSLGRIWFGGSSCGAHVLEAWEPSRGLIGKDAYSPHVDYPVTAFDGPGMPSETLRVSGTILLNGPADLFFVPMTVVHHPIHSSEAPAEQTWAARLPDGSWVSVTAAEQAIVPRSRRRTLVRARTASGDLSPVTISHPRLIRPGQSTRSIHSPVRMPLGNPILAP